MDLLLNDCAWRVQGHWPFVPIFGAGGELNNEALGVTDWIDARVPGGVHADLLRAGLIEDPYHELNSLHCEWVENRWWKYRTTFGVEQSCEGKHLTLLFKGLDYHARVYLNGRNLGEHEGMFTPASFDVTGLVRFDAANELVVILEHAPDEMSQIGYTSRTRTVKSRFAYKWDWCTRLVNIGIWDDVLLLVRDEIDAEDISISTAVKEGAASISFSCVLRYLSAEQRKRKRLRMRVYDGDVLVADAGKDLPTDPAAAALTHAVRIPDPKLWYPNGCGEQALYRLAVELHAGDEVRWSGSYRVGIRTLEYARNQGASEDSLPYTLVVNGRAVYIKGANIAPFDQMYGNVSAETYERYLKLLRLGNFNLVRVNGVGIVEKEVFYDLCDRYGIMVWQDFIQSSSGIDNIPSTDAGFLGLMRESAIAALKVKRNHACLAVWCGGNELMDAERKPITQGHPNIAMLAALVAEHDPGRLFLPSTSSGPNFSLNTAEPGRNHDIHGSWKYLGTEKHYAYYNSSDSLFHSEFGADGMSSIHGLRRFLGSDNITITDMRRNPVWRHHGEWWDCLARDTDIFGPFERLEDFIAASQLIQAEGIRYIIESNRRRKYRNSGSMVWQYNESWPNVSGTYLVEHSGIPKMAYYRVRDSYEAVHASLRYDKLSFPPAEPFRAELHVNCSGRAAGAEVEWEILDSAGGVLSTGSWQGLLPGNGAARLAEMETLLPRTPEGVFFVRLTVSAAGAVLSRNLYLFSQLVEHPFAPLLRMARVKVDIRRESELRYAVENAGSVVALFVQALEPTGRSWIYVDRNFDSLFPGERAEYVVTPVRAAGAAESMELRWEWLNMPR